MENDIFEGILLEDVVVPDVEEPKPEDDPLDYVATMMISLVLPFVITVPASWWLGEHAAVVWFGCLAGGMYFLLRYFVKRQVSAIAACVLLLAYFPVMMFALLMVMAAVPTGFHISE